MIIFPLPSQLDSLFRHASTYFHLTQRIHQSHDAPFHQISTHFDMSHPPTHLHNHDDRAKLVIFHHLHYHYHHHHQRNLSVSYLPKHNSNTSHPSIHPSRSSKQATSQTLSRLQATMTTTAISTPPRPQIYSINQSINQSLPSTNQIEPSSSSNNNNKKKETKNNNQNKGKEQFSPITKNHSLPCCNSHPHRCPCLDLIVFYYGEYGEGGEGGECGEYGECGECGECGE